MPAAPPPRVLVVGSANVDFTVAAARLPRPGETVTGGTLLVNHGGKGANQAVAARRLGAEVRFVGCVGDDAPGREIGAALAREGIGVAGVTTTDAAATGAALIVVDGEGRNQIVVAPGANWQLGAELAKRHAEDVDWADVVMCQLETPIETVAWVLGEARRRGTTTLLNPAPFRDEAAGLLPLASYVTPNETEAEGLTGGAVRDVESAAAAGRALLERGAEAAIVTLGQAGALACRCPPSRSGSWTRRARATRSTRASPWRSPRGARFPRRSAWPPRRRRSPAPDAARGRRCRRGPRSRRCSSGRDLSG